MSTGSDYTSGSYFDKGQYYDYETGLAYNRFRYYDPELGRYISQDPIGLAGGIKLYGYVGDSNSWVDENLNKSHEGAYYIISK